MGIEFEAEFSTNLASGENDAGQVAFEFLRKLAPDFDGVRTSSQTRIDEPVYQKYYRREPEDCLCG